VSPPGGAPDAPLPSEAPLETPPVEVAPTPAPAAPRPAAPAFKPSTTILFFLFILGIFMLFDNPLRIQVADGIGIVLQPLIGFGGHTADTILLTMLLAGIIEMLATALAYNWATDWVKAAKVAKWNAAFRKVQMAAVRSGKKDRIEALKQHQQRLTAMTSEVSMAQLKGMAVTWFLVIAIYTWVGIYIVAVSTLLYPLGQGSLAAGSVLWVNMGGISVNLLGKVFNFIPLWFLIFSLYTIPSSIVLRRLLKHYTLRRRLLAAPPSAGPAAGSA
jgi:uncharacterized membrane protein (DUF106 family)